METSQEEWRVVAVGRCEVEANSGAHTFRVIATAKARGGARLVDLTHESEAHEEARGARESRLATGHGLCWEDAIESTREDYLRSHGQDRVDLRLISGALDQLRLHLVEEVKSTEPRS